MAISTTKKLLQRCADEIPQLLRLLAASMPWLLARLVSAAAAWVELGPDQVGVAAIGPQILVQAFFLSRAARLQILDAILGAHEAGSTACLSPGAWNLDASVRSCSRYLELARALVSTSDVANASDCWGELLPALGSRLSGLLAASADLAVPKLLVAVAPLAAVDATFAMTVALEAYGLAVRSDAAVRHLGVVTLCTLLSTPVKDPSTNGWHTAAVDVLDECLDAMDDEGAAAGLAEVARLLLPPQALTENAADCAGWLPFVRSLLFTGLQQALMARWEAQCRAWSRDAGGGLAFSGLAARPRVNSALLQCMFRMVAAVVGQSPLEAQACMHETTKLLRTVLTPMQLLDIVKVVEVAGGEHEGTCGLRLVLEVLISELLLQPQLGEVLLLHLCSCTGKCNRTSAKCSCTDSSFPSNTMDLALNLAAIHELLGRSQGRFTAAADGAGGLTLYSASVLLALGTWRQIPDSLAAHCMAWASGLLRAADCSSKEGELRLDVDDGIANYWAAGAPSGGSTQAVQHLMELAVQWYSSACLQLTGLEPLADGRGGGRGDGKDGGIASEEEAGKPNSQPWVPCDAVTVLQASIASAVLKREQQATATRCRPHVRRSKQTEGAWRPSPGLPDQSVQPPRRSPGVLVAVLDLLAATLLWFSQSSQCCQGAPTKAGVSRGIGRLMQCGDVLEQVTAVLTKGMPASLYSALMPGYAQSSSLTTMALFLALMMRLELEDGAAVPIAQAYIGVLQALVPFIELESSQRSEAVKQESAEACEAGSATDTRLTEGLAGNGNQAKPPSRQRCRLQVVGILSGIWRDYPELTFPMPLFPGAVLSKAPQKLTSRYVATKRRRIRLRLQVSGCVGAQVEAHSANRAIHRGLPSTTEQCSGPLSPLPVADCVVGTTRARHSRAVRTSRAGRRTSIKKERTSSSRNAYVHAALLDAASRGEWDGEDTFSDLEDFICTKRGRDYEACLGVAQSPTRR
eukprot:SM000075S21985  [mRNA]  locus=s75:549067:553256:+ [translate_table: standard]